MDIRAAWADSSVFVDSEFAPLRTVVLAQSEFRAPDRHLSREEVAFLPPAMRSEVDVLRGRTFAEAFPDRQTAWEAEREGLARLLRRCGVDVLRPRLLSTAEKRAAGADGYANFFTRDPFFTVGPVVIEGAMRFPHRRNEVLPIRHLLRERTRGEACLYLAAPMPEMTDAGAPLDAVGPFIEGGDVLVLGDQVLVGMSGLATDAAGVSWLEGLLVPLGFEVHPVRLHPDILHLDCAIGLVDEGLMTVCIEALPDGVPTLLKDWDRVVIDVERAGEMAVNGLPIGPSHYVTDPVFADVGEALAARGVTVEYLDFAITRGFGGSFRCSTQPLRRA